MPSEICNNAALTLFHYSPQLVTGCAASCLSGISNLVISTYCTEMPTGQPSIHPSQYPSDSPTGMPSGQPSRQPTCQPVVPSGQPSSLPSGQPSIVPTSEPSIPTGQPTSKPTVYGINSITEGNINTDGSYKFIDQKYYCHSAQFMQTSQNRKLFPLMICIVL